jgi:hypothetical protein
MKSLLLALCFACLLAAARAEDEKIVVLDIEGAWWDGMGKELGFGSVINSMCVFGQTGSLQIAEATT